MTRRSVPLLIAVMVLSGCIRTPTPAAVDDSDALAKRLADVERQVSELDSELKNLVAQQANLRCLQQLDGEWNEEFLLEGGVRRQEVDSVVWQLNSDSSSLRTVMAPEMSVWHFGKMTVDAGKSPAWITFSARDTNGNEQIWPGIVSVDHAPGTRSPTKAVIAIPLSRYSGRTDRPRPTSFESKPNDGITIFTLQRAQN